jgi:hypothetical protein
MTDVCSVRACGPDLEPAVGIDYASGGLEVVAARCAVHGVVFLGAVVEP